MIDEEKTFDRFGYISTDLSRGSHKNVVVICDWCGKEFVRIKKESSGNRFCSRECMGKYASKNYVGEESAMYGKCRGENSHFWTGGGVLKICEQCGKEYLIKRSHADVSRFCSRECMGKYKSEKYSGENNPCWKPKIVKICEQCNEKYEIDESAADNSRFCSRECMDNWRSDSIRGQNNPNWNGGVSFEPYCERFNDDFKKKIRDKYGGRCFICGKTEERNGRKLSVHHVEYLKNCLCDGITCEFVPLCIPCHTKTNFNRFFWERTISYAIHYHEDYNNGDVSKPLLWLKI